MQFSPLGRSGLSVSRICLGTMTWGLQNTQAEAAEQINHALDAGINFMDTAEMYPVPPSGKTYADTERFIGNWIADNPERRNTTTVRVLKNRYSGLTGACCYLKYDNFTGRMSETSKPKEDIDSAL